MDNKSEEKILRGNIEWALAFKSDGVELIYSPQTDNNSLVALMIAEQSAVRAKENLTAYLKDNPNDKKALDRLSWASKTITGLKIQIQAFIEMIMYSEQPDIKAQRVELAKSMIKDMEVKIQAGEDVGMTPINPEDIKSTVTIQNKVEEE